MTEYLPARSPAATSIASAALLATLTLVGCGSGEDDAGGRPAPQASPVEVAAVVRDTVVSEVRAVGSLEAEALVTLKAETSGRVALVAVDEGARVARGDVLLRLDTTKLAAEVNVARAAAARSRSEARNLQRQLERNRDLLDGGAISTQTFDDLESSAEAAQAGLDEADARLELAERRLADATVRAPFAGEVGERSVDLGDFLEVGAPLFLIVDANPLEIAVPVPERYLGSIERGSTVRLEVRNLPDTAFEGTVVFVSPVVDPANRTVTVKARVANPDRRLLAGQFADVRLALERRPDALMIPEAAVVPGRSEDVVFRVVDGVAERRVVRLGVRSPGRVEVTSGLEAGDTVVVAGQQRLQSGAPVRATGGASQAADSAGTGG